MKKLTEKKSTRLYYGYVIVVLAFFIGAVAWGSQRTFGVFLDPLIQQFGWTRAAASLTITIQGFVTGLSAIIAGRLSDRFGPRIVLTICGVLIGTAYLLSYLIDSLFLLYILQGVVLAVGLAGIMVPLTSMVIRWFASRAGLMNGIVHAGPGFGITVIPPLIALFIARYDWNKAYLLIGGVVLIVLVIAAQFLRQQPSAMQTAPTKSGAVLKSIANSYNFTFPEAIKSRTYWILSLLLFIDIFNLNTVVVHIVVHAKDLHIPTEAAATVLSVTAALSIAGRILAGALSDRLGIRVTMAICLITSLVGFIWVIFADNLWMLYLFAVVFGIGGWGIAAVMSPLVAEHFGFKAHGAILGAISFIGTTGGAIGPLIAGAVFDSMGNYTLSFIICASIAACGLVSLLFLKKPYVKE